MRRNNERAVVRTGRGLEKTGHGVWREQRGPLPHHAAELFFLAL